MKSIKLCFRLINVAVLCLAFHFFAAATTSMSIHSLRKAKTALNLSNYPSLSNEVIVTAKRTPQTMCVKIR